MCPIPHLFSSSLCNKGPIQPYFEDSFSAFYIEGMPIRVVCINENQFPFLGSPFWVYMNMPVGAEGVLALTASRSQTGQYTCGVRLDSNNFMITVPTRSFTLVVHCKL